MQFSVEEVGSLLNCKAEGSRDQWNTPRQQSDELIGVGLLREVSADNFRGLGEEFIKPQASVTACSSTCYVIYMVVRNF